MQEVNGKATFIGASQHDVSSVQLTTSREVAMESNGIIFPETGAGINCKSKTFSRPVGLSLKLPNDRLDCNINDTPTPTTRLLGNLLKSLEESGITTLNDLKTSSSVKSDQSTTNGFGINNCASSNPVPKTKNGKNGDTTSYDNPFTSEFVEAVRSKRKVTKLKMLEPLVHNFIASEAGDNNCDESLNTPSIELNSPMGPRNELNLIATIPDTPELMKSATSFITYCRSSPNSTNILTSNNEDQGSSESDLNSKKEKSTNANRLNQPNGVESKTSEESVIISDTDDEMISKPMPLNLITVNNNTSSTTIDTNNVNNNSNRTCNTAIAVQPAKQVLLLPKPNDSCTTSTRQPFYSFVLKLPIGETVPIPMVTPITTSTINAGKSGVSSSLSTTVTAPLSGQTIPPYSISEAHSGKLSINTTQGTSVATAATSFTPISSSITSPSEIKLTTKMVQRTVTEVSNDSSQSLYQSDSRPSSQSDTGSEPSSSQRTSSSQSSVTRVKPGRKSKSAPEEDPRQKKVRSLERNRAAAMRCREKRKMAIKALEANADEMQKLNDRLQGEVAVLRKKVTELKTALLAHKDCPVTLQQLKRTDDRFFPIALRS